jgi:hypothetical protein
MDDESLETERDVVVCLTRNELQFLIAQNTNVGGSLYMNSASESMREYLIECAIKYDARINELRLRNDLGDN